MQIAAIPENQGMNNCPKTDDLSIYIHWPFCLSKCPYCDFNSHVSNQLDHDLWLKSYERELNHFKDIIGNRYIKSIFFGGGTPSLMKPLVVEKIIEQIAILAKIDEYTEVTLETNPTSFETEKFQAFRLAGINRVSIGVQSLVEEDLKMLGRQHDSKQAIKTIESARKIFPRISFDLIYARTNQTLKNWQNELTEAMQLASGHISLYQLTIEKGTLFYKLFNDGKLTIPDSDQAASMYEWTNAYLNSRNYQRYEISNYAISGHESRHNLAYWQYDNYLGIGPGAHSRINIPGGFQELARRSSGERTAAASQTYVSTRKSEARQRKFLKDEGYIDSHLHSVMMWHKPEKWLQTVNDLGCGAQVINKLSQQEIIEEILMMGLRLEKGINIDFFPKRVGRQLFDILDLEKTNYYIQLGLVRWYEEGNNKYIKLTNKGLMLHNQIVPRLTPIF